MVHFLFSAVQKTLSKHEPREIDAAMKQKYNANRALLWDSTDRNSKSSSISAFVGMCHGMYDEVTIFSIPAYETAFT